MKFENLFIRPFYKYILFIVVISMYGSFLWAQDEMIEKTYSSNNSDIQHFDLIPAKKPTPPLAVSEPVVEPIASEPIEDEYSFSNELLEHIFNSINPKDFLVDFNLNLEFNEEGDLSSAKGSSIRVDMGFTPVLSKGFAVPFTEVDPKAKKSKANIAPRLYIQGASEVRARIEFKATDLLGDFSGRVIFYKSSIINGKRKNLSSPIKVQLANKLLDMSAIELRGADIQIHLPLDANTPSTVKQNQKKDLLSVLVNCQADSQKYQLSSGQLAAAPLKKCMMGFDENGLRKFQLEEGATSLNPLEIK